MGRGCCSGTVRQLSTELTLHPSSLQPGNLCGGSESDGLRLGGHLGRGKGLRQEAAQQVRVPSHFDVDVHRDTQKHWHIKWLSKHVHRRLVYDIKACRVCTNWDCDAAQEVTSGRWVVYLIKAWFIWCTRLPSMSHRIAQNAMGLLWHPGTRSSGRRRGRP